MMPHWHFDYFMLLLLLKSPAFKPQKKKRKKERKGQNRKRTSGRHRIMKGDKSDTLYSILLRAPHQGLLVFWQGLVFQGLFSAASAVRSYRLILIRATSPASQFWL